MKIDLTKIPLAEVQDLIESTVDGCEVIIYANNAGGVFPIHGSYKLPTELKKWYQMCWSSTGECWIANGSIDKTKCLKLKPKTIDFASLPVDTLVMAEGKPLYFYAATDRKIDCYVGGKDSRSDPMPKYLDRYDIKHLTLVEGRKVVWEGGECPLPDGVEVLVGFRDGGSRLLNCVDYWWDHHKKDGDIIWYQITGKIV